MSYSLPKFSDLDYRLNYNYPDIINSVLNETHINVTSTTLPERLYLYRGKQDYITDIVKNEYFYLSRADKFEDPADCGIPEEMFNSFIKSKYEYIEHNIIKTKYKDFINEVRTNSIVCSLTSSYENIAMWDKYADNKTGICIEYNIKEYFKNRKNSGLVLYPIIYTNEIYKILPLTVENKRLMFTPGIINLLAICKTHPWSFEKEWRFFDRAKEEGRKESCPISKIYLGPDFNINPKKDEILESVKRKNIKIVQTRLENDQIIENE